MESKTKSNSLLIWISIILSIIILVLLVYIAAVKGYIQVTIPWKTTTPENTNTNSTSNSTQAQESTLTFKGQTISAAIPSTWSIKEYYNGDGTTYLSEGPTYSGLTGIEIFNASNTELFHLSAVNGIGSEGCGEYYAFKDDNPTYKAQMQSLADEIGSSMHVNDFSNTTYTEFDWLGADTRRIGTKLYLDEQTGDNYFEASCFNAVISLPGLYFTDKETNPKYESYFYGYSSTITNDELLKIDDILKSMRFVE